MKQAFKRFYGVLIAVAIVSGLTGAFAISWVNPRKPGTSGCTTSRP